MIKQLQSYSFWIPLLLFSLHQIAQKGFQIHTPFADQYLDPFCLGVIALHAFAWEQNYFFERKQLGIVEVGLIVLFLSLVTEILFPFLSDQFTADFLDSLAISLGAVWFVLTAKKTRLKLFPHQSKT